MKILDNLKSLGYDMEIREGNIRLSYRGEGKPDKEKVVPLLEELKSNKSEAIKILREGLQPISSTVLDDLLFDGVIRKTREYSIKTVRDYIRNHHKDIDERVTRTSAEVSRVYKLCKEGKATLEDFKAVLEPYHNICAKAIELCKNEKARI